MLNWPRYQDLNYRVYRSDVVIFGNFGESGPIIFNTDFILNNILPEIN